MTSRPSTSLFAAAIIGLLCAVGFAGPPQEAGERSTFQALADQAEDLVEKASSLRDATDQRIRGAVAAAQHYLHETAAAAPRMRGIHLLVNCGDTAADDQSGQALAGSDPADSDLDWACIDEASVPERLVILIHGLDEPGRVWDDLAPVLFEAGHTVARFDYPNDQSIVDSADLLAEALRDLHIRGVRTVDLIGHSKGGLIARDVLTRPGHYAGDASGGEDLPAVRRFIMLGTPNAGSPWARLQPISDAAEHIDRFLHAPDRHPRHLLGFLADGRGEAAVDLLPESDFLTELNQRPLPTGVDITIIAGVIDAHAADPADLDEDLGGWALMARAAAARHALGGRLGDGVVSLDSVQLEGVEDVVIVEASHRGMVRNSRLESAVRWVIRQPQDGPPAISIIVERLGR